MTCPCCGSNNIRTYYDYLERDVVAWIYCDGCKRRSPEMSFDLGLLNEVMDDAIMGAWEDVTQSKQPAAAQR